MFTEGRGGDTWGESVTNLQAQASYNAAVRRDLGMAGLAGVLLPTEAVQDDRGATDLSFLADGLCAQVDPEIFFPQSGGSTSRAKKVCAGCDVREVCLRYALTNNEEFGIWGGLSVEERRRLRQQQAS